MKMKKKISPPFPPAPCCASLATGATRCRDAVHGAGTAAALGGGQQGQGLWPAAAALAGANGLEISGEKWQWPCRRYLVDS